MKHRVRANSSRSHKGAAQLPAVLRPLARLVELKRYAELEKSARDTLKILPAHPFVLKALSFALIGLGNHNAALPVLSQALLHAPQDPELHNNLGICQSAMMRWHEAQSSFELALVLDGNDPEIWKNQGTVLCLMNRWDEAIPYLVKAIELFPGDYDEAINLLAGALLNAGRSEEAFTCYTELSRADPENATYLGALIFLGLKLCHWDELHSSIARLRQMSLGYSQPTLIPFQSLAIPDLTLAELRMIAECQVALTVPNNVLNGPRLTTWLPPPDLPSRRIRLGYLSYDFRNHPVAHLLPQLIELHDRERVEVFAYSIGPDDGSEIRHRLIQAFDHFEDIRSLGIEASARKIAEDGIDVLIDLQGWTTGGRLGLLALRPAPIQVSWLGYAGTMGSQRLADFLIGDPIVTPPEHAAYFAESIVRLPHCYLPMDATQSIGTGPSRSEAGLPEDAFIFCSLNSSYKFNPQVFDTWCQILRDAPKSCLWLSNPSGRGAENLLVEAVARGIAANRIIFAPYIKSRVDYMARLQLADLALDPFPYNSHSSGMDALWAGVPMVTLIGEAFAGRVGASLVAAAGLNECITMSCDEYREVSLALYREPERLRQLRQRLTEGKVTAALFDMQRFVQNLENLFIHMYETGPVPARL